MDGRANKTVPLGFKLGLADELLGVCWWRLYTWENYDQIPKRGGGKKNQTEIAIGHCHYRSFEEKTTKSNPVIQRAKRHYFRSSNQTYLEEREIVKDYLLS